VLSLLALEWTSTRLVSHVYDIAADQSEQGTSGPHTNCEIIRPSRRLTIEATICL
jgi:hypothetical protein